MEQLLVHLFGDYFLQPSWCALNKSKRSLPCLVHVLIYTACFLILTTSWKALLVIGLTHFILDRFPIIIKKLIWWREHLNPIMKYPSYGCCDTTGFFDDSPYNTKKGIVEFNNIPQIRRPFCVTVWISIIIDNMFHLIINYLALRYL
jgi:hypothetical protein